MIAWWINISVYQYIDDQMNESQNDNENNIIIILSFIHWIVFHKNENRSYIVLHVSFQWDNNLPSKHASNSNIPTHTHTHTQIWKSNFKKWKSENHDQITDVTIIASHSWILTTYHTHCCNWWQIYQHRGLRPVVVVVVVSTYLYIRFQITNRVASFSVSINIDAFSSLCFIR